MRALARLSASSFIVTAPSPAKAEPSRRVADLSTETADRPTAAASRAAVAELSRGIANLLEIAGVDVDETGVAGRDHGQAAACLDHGAGDVAAQVALRLDDELAVLALNPRHARHFGDSLVEPRA